MSFPLLGKAFTVAFAPRLETRAIFDAILSGRATACLQVTEGKYIVAGPPPLVELTYFLLRNYFPTHDRMCRIIGGLYEMEASGNAVERMTPREEARAQHEELARVSALHFSGEEGQG